MCCCRHAVEQCRARRRVTLDTECNNESFITRKHYFIQSRLEAIAIRRNTSEYTYMDPPHGSDNGWGIASARRTPKILYKDYNSYVYLGFRGVPIFLCSYRRTMTPKWRAALELWNTSGVFQAKNHQHLVYYFHSCRTHNPLYRNESPILPFTTPTETPYPYSPPNRPRYTSDHLLCVYFHNFHQQCYY